MKVYGHPLSSCTRKVLLTLFEKAESAEFIEVDLFARRHKTPEHLARQPFGLVPVLDDDGLVLYESRAILRYLDRRFPARPLSPSSPAELAGMDQWLSVDQSYIAPHVRVLAVERLIKHHEGAPADAAAERAAEAALAIAFGVVDRALEPDRYLCGDTFSLADISLMPYIGSLGLVRAEHVLSDFPRLRSWWGRVSDRPSWRHVTRAADVEA
jgi:glutathione S-transferase